MPITARSRTVQVRDDFGRFAAMCDAAAIRTVDRTVDYGVRSAKRLAPSGPKGSYTKKPGYIPLKKSIHGVKRGKTGQWYSNAPHALYVELGTGAHMIVGKMKFYWTGGYFYWNNPRFGPVGGKGAGDRKYANWNGSGAWVRHPGTRAQPFLRPSYERASRQMMKIAKEEYPG